MKSLTFCQIQNVFDLLSTKSAELGTTDAQLF